MVLYKAEIKGIHKKRRQAVTLNFVTIASSEDDAIEKIKEWFDVSGIKIDSFKAWESDEQAFCIKTEWGV